MNKLTIQRASNGFIVTRDWINEPQEEIANDLEELIKIIKATYD